MSSLECHQFSNRRAGFRRHVGKLALAAALLGLAGWQAWKPEAATARRLPEVTAVNDMAVAAAGESSSGAAASDMRGEVVPAQAAAAKEIMKEGQLGRALDEVRRRIMPIEGAAAALPENRGATHFLQNPRQDLIGRFGPEGASFAASGDGAFKVGMGYGGAGEASRIRGEGSTVTYTHADGVIEWFKNRADGVEHGFLLPAPLASRGQRELQVRLKGMEAIRTGDSNELLWGEGGGAGPVLAYSELKVWDSAGKDLVAGLSPAEGGFRISIDDRDAVYPVFVDPLITRVEAKLAPVTTGDGAFMDQFGRSVATDGVRLAVGAWGNDSFHGAVYLFVKSGEDWVFEQRLTLAGAVPGDWFGETLAIEGDTLIISAKGRTQNSSQDLGAVYAYERVGGIWTYRQMLQPADRFTGAHFGSYLALEGNRLLIGADGDDDSTSNWPGHGFIFERTGGVWEEKAKLVDPEAQPSDNLGYCVALDGDVAYLSKPTNGKGQVLAFVKNGSQWSLTARLSGALAGDRFGHSIAANGGVLAVGSNFANNLAGTVRLFRRNGNSWNQEALLTASNQGAGERFGSAVALDGNRLLVGAVTSNQQYGGGYVFDKGASGWIQKEILDPLPSTLEGLAGYSVALKGDVAFLGAPESDTPADLYTGMVHVHALKNGAWVYDSLLTAGDGEEEQEFGSSVDIEGDRVAVGMRYDNTPYGEEAGSAYVFRKVGDEWEVEAIFEDTNPIRKENFGWSVDLDGERLLVGTPFDVVFSTNPNDATMYRYGAASLFRRGANGWELEKKLASTVLAQNGNFGRRVSLRGDVALIVGGAPYVFRKNGATWQQEAMLNTSGYSTSDAVLQQDRVLVATTGRGNAAGNLGAVFEYLRQGGSWVLTATVEPQSWLGNETFGVALAADGDVMVVGTRSGAYDSYQAAYVFRRDASGWHQEARLVSPDADAAAPNDFGITVACKAGTVLVGAPADAPRAGSVHVFRQASGGAWTRVQKLSVEGLKFQDGFGTAIATDGEAVVVAAPQESVANPLTGDIAEDQGSVYVFRLGDGVPDVDLRRQDQPFYSEGNAVMDFGWALVGGYKPPVRLEIVNQGTVPLTGISLQLGGVEAGQFEIGTYLQTVAPGEVMVVELRFGPISAGVKTATLMVQTNDPDEVMRTIQLMGTGNSEPRQTQRKIYGVEGRPIMIPLEDLAYDPDGDPIHIEGDGEPSNTSSGIFRYLPGAVVFEPKAGLTGTVNFGFGVADDKGSSHLVMNYLTLVPASSIPADGAMSRIAADTYAVSLKGWPAGAASKVQRSRDLKVWEHVGTMTADPQGRVLLIEHGLEAGTMYYRLAE